MQTQNQTLEGGEGQMQTQNQTLEGGEGQMQTQNQTLLDERVHREEY